MTRGIKPAAGTALEITPHKLLIHAGISMQNATITANCKSLPAGFQGISENQRNNSLARL
jgi:hypothetical protein